jgi:hypothetical protein
MSRCLAALAGAVLLGLPAAATADVTTLEGTDRPIVRINIRAGDVTIRTWDRESVAVDGDPSLAIQRRFIQQSAQQNPVAIPPVLAGNRVDLPAESFVVTSIPPGRREAIVVKSRPLEPGAGAGPPTPVTVTIPADAVFVFAHTGRGTLDVHGYRGGTLVTFAPGRTILDGVGGTVFAQTRHGALVVNDSTFDRLRARSIAGNLTFERCSVRQIEATSLDGSIVYDGGTFEPGLAHFESMRGNVAVGATGPVELGAHAAGDGRVYTNFAGAATVDARESEARATLGGGGTLVTATTQSGNVYLYDGTLRAHRNLPAAWHEPEATLRRPGVRVPVDGPHAIAAPRELPAPGRTRRPAAATPLERRFGERIH